MSKHTPGPWSVRAIEKILSEAAQVELYEIEADARLIAAAPEMLEALKKARSVLEATHFAHHLETLPLIDSVIAKAEPR